LTGYVLTVDGVVWAGSVSPVLELAGVEWTDGAGDFVRVVGKDFGGGFSSSRFVYVWMSGFASAMTVHWTFLGLGWACQWIWYALRQSGGL
jgi:hypothetical protein